MYSKNDYRYYLERPLGSDFIAHERSHKYIKKIGDRYFYSQQELAAFLGKDNLKKKFNENYRTYNISGEHGVYGGPNGQIKTGTVKYKERGIESKNSNKYVSVGSHKYSDGRSSKDLYFSPTKKEHYVKKGRVTISTGEEGSHISVDTTKKKKGSAKQKIARVRKKYGLYREKPTGKKLKGSNNIYVSHN